MHWAPITYASARTTVMVLRAPDPLPALLPGFEPGPNSAKLPGDPSESVAAKDHVDLARTVNSGHQPQLDVAGLARPRNQRQAGGRQRSIGRRDGREEIE